VTRLNSFHLPAESWPGNQNGPWVLDGPEARHLLKVLRAAPGERLRLFDGQGREGLFVLESAERGRALLTPESITALPLPQDRLVLALGWNKSSRRDWLLEKAVELGAWGLAFWRAERSQGEPPTAPKDSWQDKLVQAAKQCANPWLPQLAVIPGGIQGLAAFAQGFEQCYLCWEKAETRHLPAPGDLGRGRVLVVLGPEGGLEPVEADRLLEAGFRPLSLGPSVLRWETAALLCMGLAHLDRGSRP